MNKLCVWVSETPAMPMALAHELAQSSANSWAAHGMWCP